MRTLVWFRGKDLRVADHAPLADSAQGPGSEVIPLFVLDPYFFAPKRAKELPNRMQYLVGSLAELADSIKRLGSRLVVVEGKSIDVIPKIARTLKVDRVVAYRWTEPIGVLRDKRIKEALAQHEIPFDLYEGETLVPPSELLTGSKTPFAVFTPFANAFLKRVEVSPPRRAPKQLPPLPSKVGGIKEARIPSVEDLGIERNPRIVKPGESAARARLQRFLKGRAGKSYNIGRDRMGEEDGTSRISQDLKFGTLSIRTAWSFASEALMEAPKARRTFLNELLWREFAYYILFHHPRVLSEPYKAAWNKFPWRKDAAGWRAWVEGKTGYPIVDASARQLLLTGFVHNRARMISASFLTKHLLIHFRDGEAHFLKYLTDGDWAANDLGWQWVTGCGVDAQPYFRVFNPVLQGEKLDPEGDYVRRWVPELAKLSSRFIHQPWAASEKELVAAGVVLGQTYPQPIVDHAFARKRFLSAAEEHLGRREKTSKKQGSKKASRK